MTTQLSESLSIREGRLFIEDCDVADLAEEFGTPLFIVSEQHLHLQSDSAGEIDQRVEHLRIVVTGGHSQRKQRKSGLGFHVHRAQGVDSVAHELF